MQIGRKKRNIVVSLLWVLWITGCFKRVWTRCEPDVGGTSTGGSWLVHTREAGHPQLHSNLEIKGKYATLDRGKEQCCRFVTDGNELRNLFFFFVPSGFVSLALLLPALKGMSLRDGVLLYLKTSGAESWNLYVWERQ